MSYMVEKPISSRSKHQIGDMYIHKKHKFIVRVTGRGQWSATRWVEVIKGQVPSSVIQRLTCYEPPANYEDYTFPAGMEYSTCALSLCFDKLKAGQILFGENNESVD